MIQSIVAFLCGSLFAVGLALSGMTRPGKVIGFLDFFGDWDPSLAFVMGGAIFVYAIGFRFVTKRSSPILANFFQIPTNKKIDKKILVGAALFGIGWGIAGYCPGPALVSLSTGRLDAIIFAIAMLSGILVFKVQSGKVKK